MTVPELLSPAGSMDALEAAIHFGADAVYAGLKRFGLRAFAGNFGQDELHVAAEKLHAENKKLYVTMNAYPFDDEMDDFLRAAEEAEDAGADAVIVSDPGAILALRKARPGLKVHVSTQANTVNTLTARMYGDLGCERVILAREMSLERIRILSRDAGLQTEVFVHGASCVAYSGRCLLSAYLTGRSANRGECAQPCRWRYAVMEEKRPGEYYPLCEDENGSYLFSARDLCLMPLLPELCGAGISALKIEGRMKTEYYVAVVTAAYRRALDMLKTDENAFRAALPEMIDELTAASHRDSDTGFMLGQPRCPAGAEGCHQAREYLGKVLETDGEQARLLLKNRFYAGDRLELMTPGGVRAITAEPFLREKTGTVETTLGIAGEVIRIRLPGAGAGDMLRGPVRNHRT